ncbi:hypothetical protein [Actinoplanes sp. N902-109]|uniref:hypothetical protein n=1 Tax=Actinoplanes sp. (strain N902-109) TaxID=649831 RepID=UPI0003293ED8|nr:hypothetical protein [Actinoplanes sp. N902-109]AGL16034.1 hypothetical protein L083_2524 [Actinoplanes sp. N902-109]
MSRLTAFLITLGALAALVVVFLAYGLTAAVATGVVLALAGAATTVVLRLGGAGEPVTPADAPAVAAELGGEPGSEQPLV